MKTVASRTLRGNSLSALHKKHQEQPGRRQRRVLEVDQIVRIQLPSAEDGEGFLRNIRGSKT